MHGMCGGFKEAEAANQEVVEVLAQVKAEVEAKENSSFQVFEAVTFTSQVVAGTNFLIKVKYDGGYMHVKVHRPLPHTNQGPSLMEHETGKTLEETLTPFYGSG